jgi:hypothetical protein
MILLLKVLGYLAFAAIFFIIPACVVIYIILTARKTTIEVGRCRNCGYDLKVPLSQGGIDGDRNKEISNRCPKCDRPFIRDADGQPFS